MRLQAEAEARKHNLDEWVKAINEHGGFGIWQWAVSKDPADVAGILENIAGRRTG